MKQLKDYLSKNIKNENNNLQHALLQEYDVRIVNAEDTQDDHPENTTTWKAFWEEETGKKIEELLPEKMVNFSVRDMNIMIKAMAM